MNELKKHGRHLSFKNNDISIDLNLHGSDEYKKVSFPLKYGLFSRLETGSHIFEFNLNHEIRHAKFKGRQWHDPSEWLKRSLGNDWIYYSTGGYSGVFEAIGEYYLPNLMYQTNSLLGGKPFEDDTIARVINHWHDILSETAKGGIPSPFSEWIQKAVLQTPEQLQKKADQLFEISGSRISVMPPDARHVDYNFIPLTICDGCLYKCRFCRVKNHKKFTPRSGTDIDSQLDKIRKLLGRDLVNYNALFLGEHDALNAPDDLICQSIEKAYEILEFKHSYMKSRSLFMFGSADALLKKGMRFFKQLNAYNFQTYINIGLESGDQKTLDLIGKPITAQKVEKTFERIQEVNAQCLNVEITSNFIMDDGLPDSHLQSIQTLIRDRVSGIKPKGAVYFSPLRFNSPSRQVLYDFYKIKTLSRFPAYLYIIQRL